MDVKIVTLEPMIAASFYAFGRQPESGAMEKMGIWAEEKGITGGGENHPVYGFNNPPPGKPGQKYGYECWIKVDPETEPEGDMRVILFMGGSYAMTRCKGILNVGATWRALFDWCKTKGYKIGSHQGLEQVAGGETLENLELDLYCPIIPPG